MTMMHFATSEFSLQRVANTSSILAVGAIFILLFRRLYRKKVVQDLERLHGCERPPTESDRFRYDLFGIAKAVELGFHFRRRTALPYTTSLFRRYGATYESNILGYRLIFTCDPKNTTQLLSTAFGDFDSSPLRKPLFEPITPHGIFTLDGADWKKSREKLRTRLSGLRKVIDLDLCEQHFQAFLQHVPPNGKMFDIQDPLFALSLDIQSLFSLGESLDALGFSQSRENKRCTEDLLFVKERIVHDGFLGPLRHLFSGGEFSASCQRLRRYVQARVIDAETRQSTSSGSDPCQEVENDARVSELTDQALSILLANDSMGTALSALFFCLAKNQGVLRKLRESILDTVGLAPPSWEKLGALHYVRWTLNEGKPWKTWTPNARLIERSAAMRLFPAAVLNARIANKDSKLPSGGGENLNSPVLVRKGDVVVFSTWAQHRLCKDFGKDLDEFYPERWESLSVATPGYIPFNRGPRVCPGRKSLHFLFYVLAYVN